MSVSAAPAPTTIDLAGTWRFAFGDVQPAIPQSGLPRNLRLDDTIALPGTMETRGKGPLNPEVATHHLTRVRKWDGVAWYGRQIEIPAAWAGQRIVLELERTKWSQVWLDGKPLGQQALFGSVQRIDLSAAASPGSHDLVIAVDNRRERWNHQTNDAHQYSDNTQTNWNGLLGTLRLIATPTVWLDDVQVCGDVAAKTFSVRIDLGGVATATGTVRVQATSFNHEGLVHAASVEAAVAGARTTVVLPLGDGAKRWDEFAPAMYRLDVTLTTPAGTHVRTIETGLRSFTAVKTEQGTQLAINGRVTFLRGKHDACVFPRTGHCPLDVDGWLAYLGICRDYGINHLRCHTWVPPEAAFAAADRLGIYLQPEIPFWGAWDEKTTAAFWPEIEAVLREYGNHPSFVMFTLGNEVGGSRDELNAVVKRLKALDPRRLYSDGSNNFLWDPRRMAEAEFFVSAKVRHVENGPQEIIRGSYCVLDGPHGFVQYGKAETRTDLTSGIAGEDIPIIGHEIGQFTVYPDFREIAKHDGVVQARNFERFRSLLDKHGMLDQAHDFFHASGALMADLYKEDMELALRTKGFSGYQLLDLQDFPGQGTALVGILDPFMDNKGLISRERWCESNDVHVVLARFDRYVWSAGETYVADIQLAHYGVADLSGAVVAWRLATQDGKRTVASGTFPAQTITQGGVRDLGTVRAALTREALGMDAAVRLDLDLTVTAGPVRAHNVYPVWVYPAAISTAAPDGVVVVRAWNAETKRLLTEGHRVVLIPEGSDWGNTVPGAYCTDYWCWPMFNNTPGTMGLLMDPAHPALASFPTAFHSERQWTDIAKQARPAILSQAPGGFRPIVQVVDNLERNERLGLVFEGRVGAGRLLVVACDLVALGQTNPEAKQLLASLLAYAGSGAFAPVVDLDSELESVLRPNLALNRLVTASSWHQPPWGLMPKPEKAVDGDITTRWWCKEGDANPWLTVHLEQPRRIDTIELLWDSDEPGWHHRIEVSSDGGTWKQVVEQTSDGWGFFGNRHRFTVDLSDVRHLRVTVLKAPAGKRAALRDLRILGH